MSLLKEIVTVAEIKKQAKDLCWSPYQSRSDAFFSFVGKPVIYPVAAALATVGSAVGAVYYVFEALGNLCFGSSEDIINSLTEVSLHLAAIIGFGVLTALTPVLAVVGSITRIAATCVGVSEEPVSESSFIDGLAGLAGVGQAMASGITKGAVPRP